MLTLFVVVAGIDYEGSTPIRAFAERYDAKEFATKCHEYERTRPTFPPGAHIDSAEIDAWSAADKQWVANHPGAENGLSGITCGTDHDQTT